MKRDYLISTSLKCLITKGGIMILIISNYCSEWTKKQWRDRCSTNPLLSWSTLTTKLWAAYTQNQTNENNMNCFLFRVMKQWFKSISQEHKLSASFTETVIRMNVNMLCLSLISLKSNEWAAGLLWSRTLSCKLQPMITFRHLQIHRR